MTAILDLSARRIDSGDVTTRSNEMMLESGGLSPRGQTAGERSR